MAELFFDIEKSNRERDKEFAEVEKFNPYHGADGRFTSGSGAASFTYKPGASKGHDAAISREKGKTSSSSDSSVKQTKDGKSYIERTKMPGKPVASGKNDSFKNISPMVGGNNDTAQKEVNRVLDNLKEGRTVDGKKFVSAKTSGKKNQPEGDRAISNRKGGETMDDIGTHKVSTSSTISALKQAGFKKKDIKQIQRQYDLSDAQAKEISDNWSKYH